MVRHKKTTRPIYGDGKVINERVFVERKASCNDCGAKWSLETQVALAKDIDPSWKAPKDNSAK